MPQDPVSKDSKLQMNWMFAGCQGVINNQFGSLMIISFSEKVSVTLASANDAARSIYSGCYQSLEHGQYMTGFLLIGLCWNK